MLGEQGLLKLHTENLSRDILLALTNICINIPDNSFFVSAGHKKEKQKALSPAAVLENLRHTLVDYQNRCSNASAEVSV